MLPIPYDKQAWTIQQATARINLWDGSISAGKTVATYWRWIQYVAYDEVPGSKAMIGKTERALKRNIIDPLIELFGSDNIRHSQGSGECIVFGHRVYIVGANDARAEHKIRGVTLAGALGDEVTLWPEDFFTMLLGRLRIPGAKFFGTTNPDNPAHWLKKNYIDRVGELDLKRFHFVIDDNPTLDPPYVKSIKAEYTGLWYRRYILGEWCVAEGAIYDMFEVARHVVSELPKAARNQSPISQWFVSCDYGTANPTVFLLLGIGIDNRLYVVDEWRHDSRKAMRQMTDAEYSKALQGWLSGHNVSPRWILVDPSAASFIAQLHRDRVPNVAQADNSVLDGIRDVSTLLSADRLKIHQRCTGLIEELQGYVWDEKAQLQGEDKPVKVNDHGCLVAGTLVETDCGPRPIEAIRAGERVLTRQGYKRVLASGMTAPSTPVSTVTLSNGQRLTGTGDHPIWIRDRGWCSLDALRYGDILQGCPELMGVKMPGTTATVRARHGRVNLPCAPSLLDPIHQCVSLAARWSPVSAKHAGMSLWPILRVSSVARLSTAHVFAGSARSLAAPNLWSSMASRFGGILSRRSGRNGRISLRGLPTANAELGASIKRSGSPFMARFPMAMRSIIATMTHSITILATSNASPNRRTTIGMPRSEASAAVVMSSLLTWRLFARLPLNGITQKRASSGIVSMVSAPGSPESRWLRFAISAATDLRVWGARRLIAFAPMLASLHGAGLLVSMMSSDHATHAVTRSPSTDTPNSGSAPVHVVSVHEETEWQAVYNLSVEDAPEYYAGGVLVHNCDALRYGIRGTSHIWRRWLRAAGKAA